MKVKVKVSSGKSKGGTIIARKTVALKKSAGPQGKPIWQTRAQLNVHLRNENGQPRARSR